MKKLVQQPFFIYLLKEASVIYRLEFGEEPDDIGITNTHLLRHTQDAGQDTQVFWVRYHPQTVRATLVSRAQNPGAQERCGLHDTISTSKGSPNLVDAIGTLGDVVC